MAYNPASDLEIIQEVNDSDSENKRGGTNDSRMSCALLQTMLVVDRQERRSYTAEDRSSERFPRMVEAPSIAKYIDSLARTEDVADDIHKGKKYDG